MIIQIRGTSGSGKSTVMRKVVGDLNEWEEFYTSGRKRPLYYQRCGVIVLGHYESPCGGCDTIGSARQVYEVIQKLLCNCNVMLCEGLLLSEDVKWSSQFKDLRVLFLTTPLPTCLSWIENRRKEAGNEKPLNSNNTSNRVEVIERARKKLLGQGIICRRVSTSQAPGIVLRWIKESRHA